jgi:uncharacterized protein YndB with AHSA1/START domain
MKKSETINEHGGPSLSSTGKLKDTVTNFNSRGTIIFDEKYGTIKFERRLAQPKEMIWKSITDINEISKWLPNYKGTFEGYNGGSINLVNTVSGSGVTGNILVCDPESVLEYEWHIAPSPMFPIGEPESLIRWELKSDENSSKNVILSMTHRRLTKPTTLLFAPGWHVYLDRLEASLDNKIIPDWLQRLGEVKELYAAS